jgi:hypothetical protein
MRVVFYYFIMTFAIFFICGCTIPTHIYIRNNTNGNKEMTLITNNICTDSLSFYFSPVNFNDDQLSLKIANKLTRKLFCNMVNDTVGELILPPHSITLIEKSYNFSSKKFKSLKYGKIEIINDGYRYGSGLFHSEKDKYSHIKCYNID